MRNQINTIAEKINDQVTEQVTTATKTYTETNDRILDAIVDTNRKAVDFAVKTFDQINDRIADQTPSIELPFDMPKMDALRGSHRSRRWQAVHRPCRAHGRHES